MLRTNIKAKPQQKENMLVSESDVFAFGRLLKALVEQLTIEAVRGELPFFGTGRLECGGELKYHCRHPG